MSHYQKPYGTGHPVRLNAKGRGKRTCVLVNDILSQDGTTRLVLYKTGISTGEATFNVANESGKKLYEQFLKLLKRG